jgi:hypothetical protein
LNQGSMKENISCATLGRSVYIQCIYSCWSHQLVTSGIQNVVLISIGLECKLLWLRLPCPPQNFGTSGNELTKSLAATN